MNKSVCIRTKDGEVTTYPRLEVTYIDTKDKEHIFIDVEATTEIIPVLHLGEVPMELLEKTEVDFKRDNKYNKRRWLQRGEYKWAERHWEDLQCFYSQYQNIYRGDFWVILKFGNSDSRYPADRVTPRIAIGGWVITRIGEVYILNDLKLPSDINEFNSTKVVHIISRLLEYGEPKFLELIEETQCLIIPELLDLKVFDSMMDNSGVVA
ncbi:MAG: hypothetical protein KAS32_15000 [Candidatus Peribacteraceae bacterium]|nr:hypothetical protein [Candidatus Peribacteraceae bacterium]